MINLENTVADLSSWKNINEFETKVDYYITIKDQYDCYCGFSEALDRSKQIINSFREIGVNETTDAEKLRRLFELTAAGMVALEQGLLVREE